MSIPARRRVPRVGTRSGDLIARIGNTPLIRIRAFENEFPHVAVFGKAEWHNPGGSVKDRAALRMIVEAELTGRLRPGQTILDATSGNTGIAYAWIGAVKGYPVRLFVPANASTERKRILDGYGAEVTYTDPIEGMDGTIERTAALFHEDPDAFFYPNQYQNPANWKAHYDGTAVEIWQQTRAQVTHFVAGLGTSGTFVGTTRRLKTLAPNIWCTSVEPDEPFHGLEGLKHMASSLVPGIYDPHVADDHMRIKTEDAYKMIRRLARREGLLVGLSSGAALVACERVAATIPDDEEAVIVTILADSGERYLSERFWEEAKL